MKLNMKMTKVKITQNNNIICTNICILYQNQLTSKDSLKTHVVYFIHKLLQYKFDDIDIKLIFRIIIFYNLSEENLKNYETSIMLISKDRNKNAQ